MAEMGIHEALAQIRAILDALELTTVHQTPVLVSQPVILDTDGANKRSKDRHKPGYMADYMRKRRAA